MKTATQKRTKPVPFHRRPLRERLRLATGMRLVGFALLAGAMAVLAAAMTPDYAWLVGVALGAGLVASGWRGVSRAAAVRSWPIVAGTIRETSVGEFARPGRVSWYIWYYPRVSFEYESTVGRLTSERFTIAPLDHASLDPADPERMLEPYPAGADVDVRVSPENPHVAVLYAEVSRRRRSQDLAVAISGILIAALALLIGLYTPR